MKMKMFKSIRSQLTIWYAVVLGLIFLVSDIILYRSFKLSLIDTMDQTLYTAAEDVEQSIFKVPGEKWQATIKQLERGFLVNRLFIQVLEISSEKTASFRIAARSGVLSGNISQQKVWDELSQQLPPKPVYMNVTEESPAIHPLRIILYPVQQEGNKAYLIQVGTSLKKMFSTLKDFLMVLIFSGPVLLLISVLGGYFILTRVLHPMKTVVQTAKKITAEDLSLRIQPNNQKNEIGQLIITFNEMISRLERSVLQIKQFSSDASHDLKTPLTVIRGEVDIALRKNRPPAEYIKTLTSVREEAKKLEGIIDNLLFLSCIDSRSYQRSFENVHPDEILLEVFEKTTPLANEKQLAYVLEKIERISLPGDPILLSRLLMNLVDNAIKYTPPGGRIQMSLKNSGEKTILAIQDNGIGIPENALPFIFNRFYRVDQSRTQRNEGAGLGLSIVKKIADIHQAEVDIHSQLNKGTTILVSFPLSST
ncbi:MAG: ATP-binding protein [Candidatus Aminicenantes bacterium]|jgi:heavy metal sensor kinase